MMPILMCTAAALLHGGTVAKTEAMSRNPGFGIGVGRCIDISADRPFILGCTAVHFDSSVLHGVLQDFQTYKQLTYGAAMDMRATPPSKSPSVSKKTVLVVDADPAVSEMLSTVLAPDGWSIQNAPDNKAVLDLIGNRPFDLIITGEKTSGREDVELLNKIRRVRPHTRMIILTDSSTPADAVACIRERAFSYFSKPFSMEALAEMVRIATEGPCWDDGIELVSATPEWIRLVARCDLKTADRLIQFLREMSDLPEREKTDVAIAFREMLLNAMEHGGRFDPNQYVEISYVSTRRMVGCRVKDPGEGFSRDELPHAAISNPPDDPIRHFSARQARNLRPGGFGVLMARNLVDELLYNEKGNEVLLVKYLDRGTAGDAKIGEL